MFYQVITVCLGLRERIQVKGGFRGASEHRIYGPENDCEWWGLEMSPTALCMIIW